MSTRESAVSGGILRAGGSLALLIGLGIGAAGCRQDMHDQPKYIPYRPTTFYADRRSERPLVEGTVPRGDLREDELLETGKASGADATVFPVTVDLALLDRGRERFNIFCSPCHGRIGDGEGMVVQRGYRRPPTFHQDRLRDAPVGHFVDVISNGFGAMPDYAAQIPPRDRWAIVAYIRALQLSQHTAVAELPAGTTLPAADTGTPRR
jgi:mono/diheme cytochrome c family protein